MNFSPLPSCDHPERGHAPCCFKCQTEHDQREWEATAPERAKQALFLAQHFHEIQQMPGIRRGHHGTQVSWDTLTPSSRDLLVATFQSMLDRRLIR